MLDLFKRRERRDYHHLSRRFGLSISSHATLFRSPHDLLSSSESRGFLMNDEKWMKTTESILRGLHLVSAAELVKDYLQEYSGRLPGIQPESFGELKVRLRQTLAAKHVYGLGTLFELDEILQHPAPALRLLDKLCSKNIIDEHNVSPLLKAFKTINHYVAATIVEGYIKEHNNH